MKKKLLLLLVILSLIIHFSLFSQQIVLNNGMYYVDATQTKFYSGEYREFHANGALKLDIFIKDGKPEGPYVVYFENGKPQEIRSYLNGEFHGIWRSYNTAGILVAEAEYQHNLKSGCWKVWDDNGVLRYEMNYREGKKIGMWYMWDEKGKLMSEKNY
ncbi:MAG: toxin-antitoxin system YwqK family antitoxin [Bacteroidales bacterium]